MDFGARLYDPVICRWLSQDPLAFSTPSVSPYSYCAGDPVNYIDPTGMEFTEESQKYVEELKQAIRARRMNNAREIKKLKRQISSGDLTDDKVEYCKCQINSLKDDTAEMKKIQGELALLGDSDQIYDIFETDVYNTDTHATSAALYNFFTGVFEIQLGENTLFQLAHELLHAYQFETGAYSCSFEQKGLPFYDQDDEKAAYKRGQLFGGPSFTDYEKNYSQFQAGPCSVRGSYPRKAFHHPSAFQRLANNTCSAFRVNGTTFVVETQILEKLILK